MTAARYADAEGTAVIITRDGVDIRIPADPRNSDWRDLQEQLAAGEATIAAHEAPPDPRPPHLIIAEALTAAIDAAAQERGYSSIVSAATYLTSANPTWAAEAAALIAWRDTVWSTAYAALAAWESGGTPTTPEAILAAAGPVPWPEPEAP